MSVSSARIRQGYDPVTLNHFLWYKYHCHECTPSEFQRLFENIIKRSKPEFMQIRPYGNIGDRKCDGLFASERKVFQVYSPDDMKLAELKIKIDEDLRLAVEHWREQMEQWTFVYNARRGLAPDVPGILAAQSQLYPELTLDHLSSDALWEIARSLTLQQRCEILGAPNGYEYLFLAPSATPADIRAALENGWFVIVHDTMTPISLPAITNALKPCQPFGAPIYIRPEIGSLPWTEAAKYQRTALLDAIEKSRDVLPRFAIFSLSQIPLCIHLGFVLSDRLDVRCFQFDRDQRTWYWPEDTQAADVNIIVKGMPTTRRTKECEVVIRVSLSATISTVATREAAGHHPVEVDIAVAAPDVMWLRSPRQLSVLGQTFRTVLSQLRDKVPNCTRLHLFYAGPTGGAVVLGQQINPRMNPPIELYEYSRQISPNHQRALTLDENV
jgi:SMODS-associated and fused to various effectors sensor domain